MVACSAAGPPTSPPGCAGDGKCDDPAGGDGGGTADAGSPTACPLSDPLDLEPGTSNAVTTAKGNFRLEAPLGAGDFPRLIVEAASSTSDGPHEISGLQTNYETCSYCVRIVVDENFKRQYMAVSGTIDFRGLGSVPDGVSVTMDDLLFAEIDLDRTTWHSEPSDSGCVSSVETMKVGKPSLPPMPPM